MSNSDAVIHPHAGQLNPVPPAPGYEPHIPTPPPSIAEQIAAVPHIQNPPPEERPAVPDHDYIGLPVQYVDPVEYAGANVHAAQITHVDAATGAADLIVFYRNGKINTIHSVQHAGGAQFETPANGKAFWRYIPREF